MGLRGKTIPRDTSDFTHREKVLKVRTGFRWTDNYQNWPGGFWWWWCGTMAWGGSPGAPWSVLDVSVWITVYGRQQKQCINRQKRAQKRVHEEYGS